MEGLGEGDEGVILFREVGRGCESDSGVAI